MCHCPIIFEKIKLPIKKHIHATIVPVELLKVTEKRANTESIAKTVKNPKA